MKRSTKELPRGVTLLEALLRDVGPEVRHQLVEYGERATTEMFELPDGKFSRYFRLRFERAFQAKLISGDLVGTGVYLPPDPQRPRRVIPAELWKHVFVNYEESLIEWGNNRKIVDIEVLTAAELAEWETARHSSTLPIEGQFHDAA